MGNGGGATAVAPQGSPLARVDGARATQRLNGAGHGAYLKKHGLLPLGRGSFVLKALELFNELELAFIEEEALRPGVASVRGDGGVAFNFGENRSVSARICAWVKPLRDFILVAAVMGFSFLGAFAHTAIVGSAGQALHPDELARVETMRERIEGAACVEFGPGMRVFSREPVGLCLMGEGRSFRLGRWSLLPPNLGTVMLCRRWGTRHAND